MPGSVLADILNFREAAPVLISPMVATTMAEKFSILALHGFTGSGTDFDLARSLFPADVAWDTPDIPALPLDNLCEFLRGRWEKLSGSRTLLGYSMGGRIALHLVARLLWRAGDKLVLVSASPGLADPQQRAARRNNDELLAREIDCCRSAAEFYERWRQTPLIATQDRMPPPWRERLLASRCRGDLHTWASHLRLLGTGMLPSLWGKLGGIVAAETLIVVGEKDAKFSRIAAQMVAEIPHCRRIVVAESGHAPHLENAAEFARLLSPLLFDKPALL